MNILRRIFALLGLAGIPLAACDNEYERTEPNRTGDYLEERRANDETRYEGTTTAVPYTGVTGQVPVPANAATPVATIETTVETTVDIDPALVSVCDLPDQSTVFEVNTASFTGEGVVLLDEVARCMTMGGLLGQDIDLVSLGMSDGTLATVPGPGADRALVVREYLVQKGIDGNRITFSPARGAGTTADGPDLQREDQVVIRMERLQESTAGLEADEY